MPFSNWSGPVRIGTQKDQGIANTGLPLLTQAFTIPATAMLTAPAALVAFRLPAGSKIIGFAAEVTTAITTATNVGLTFGVQGGSATQYMTSVSTGVAVGKVAQAGLDTALQVVNANNIGTFDVAVTVTPTAATGNAAAGQIVVTCLYIQRATDGSQAPANA